MQIFHDFRFIFTAYEKRHKISIRYVGTEVALFNGMKNFKSKMATQKGGVMKLYSNLFILISVLFVLVIGCSDEGKSTDEMNGLKNFTLSGDVNVFEDDDVIPIEPTPIIKPPVNMGDYQVWQSERPLGDVGYTSDLDDEDNIYVIGYSERNDNELQKGYSIAKFDKYGRFVWSKRGFFSEGPLFVSYTFKIKFNKNNKRLYIMGELQDEGWSFYKMFIAMHDSNSGNLIDTYVHDSTYSTGRDITIFNGQSISDCRIYVIGKSSATLYESATLFEFDCDLNLLLEDDLSYMKYFDEDNLYASNIAVDNDHNIYLTLELKKSAIYSSSVLLAKINYWGTGDSWIREFNMTGDEYPNDLVIDSFGNIFIEGESNYYDINGNYRKLFILKYDNLGNLIWEKIEEVDYVKGKYIYSIDVNDHGIYATSTECVLNDDKDCVSIISFVSKYDFSGNLIATKSFGTGAQSHATDLKLNSYGDMIMVGETHGSFNGFTNPDEYEDLFVIKVFGDKWPAKPVKPEPIPVTEFSGLVE